MAATYATKEQGRYQTHSPTRLAPLKTLTLNALVAGRQQTEMRRVRPITYLTRLL